MDCGAAAGMDCGAAAGMDCGAAAGMDCGAAAGIACGAVAGMDSGAKGSPGPGSGAVPCAKTTLPEQSERIDDSSTKRWRLHIKPIPTWLLLRI